MKKHIIITTIAFILGTTCGVVGTVLVEKQDVQKEVTTEIATNTDATTTEKEIITTEIATDTDATTEEVITTENITEIDTSFAEITTTEEVTMEVAEEISTTETYYEPTTEEAPDEEPTTEATTEAPSTEANGMTYLGTYSLTAYCSCVNCCGKSNGITASGTQATAGRTVACNSLPLGTVISINGHQYVVEDTGGMGGNVIDIYFSSHEEAINFGRQSAEVYLVN